MFRRSFALLLLLVPSACSIPARENPKDPSNIPDARVEVYENAVGGDPIVQASFTESVFLAAGKSEPADHDLRVSWFVSVPGLTDLLPVDGGTENPIGTRRPLRFNSVLPPELVRDSGVAGVSVIGRVRDPSTGGVGEASRFFQVLNAPPVIEAQSYVEVSPGGRWWVEGGGAIETLLDVTATDPDRGDSPITVTWTQTGGRTVPTGPAPQQDDLLVIAPMWEQTVTFRATARDTAGAETSADVTLVVQDVVWLADASGFVQRAQEPPIAVSTTNAAWTLGAATSTTGGTVVWTAEDDGNTWRVVRRAPEIGEAFESSHDTGIASTNPLQAGAFTDNDGIAWMAAGDVILAYDDAAPGGPAAGPVLAAPGHTLLSLGDGLTAPRSLAPVAGSASGDAWALLDEGGAPTVRRVSAASGVAATGTVVAGAIAIEPAGDGGAWLLVSDPDDDQVEPSLVRLDAAGAAAATLPLPYPETARARTFSARAPLQGESVRFAIAGGNAPANSFLALVDAHEGSALPAVVPSDGLSGSPILRIAVRLQEAPISDVAMDPQDGGAWSVVPSTGVVRKHDFLGGVVRSAGALDFLPGVPPTITSDRRTGSAWVADQGFRMLGVPGTPLVPYPASNALSVPDRVQFDPARNRIAAASLGDSSVVVLRAGELRNQFFLPDLGATTGPVGATFDPESGCLWFASGTRLVRDACASGSRLPDVAHAPIAEIRGIDFASWYDPGAGIEPGLCIAGSTTGGQLRVMRLDADGNVVWPAAVIPGVDMLGLSAAPTNGDCWFLTDIAVGYANAVTGAIAFTSPGTDIGRTLTAAPDGSALYIDPDDDEVVRVQRNLSVDPSFIDFTGTDTFRNARSVAVDPVRGVIWVAVGPRPGDESAAALLQFSPDGERLGLVPAIDPLFLGVNR